MYGKVYIYRRNLPSSRRFWAVSDSSDVWYPTIALTQMEPREQWEKKGKNSNLSTVRGGFPPRGLIVRAPQILTSFLAACPVRRCVCMLWSRERCVWCEREEVIRVRAHVRVVTQNLHVCIHQNKELDDFGLPSLRDHVRSDMRYNPSASLES